MSADMITCPDCGQWLVKSELQGLSGPVTVWLCGCSEPKKPEPRIVVDESPAMEDEPPIDDEPAVSPEPQGGQS